MKHVFISYVHENTDLVKRLSDILRVYDIEVWLDRESIKPGQRWADAIQSAIRDGAYYLACFSKEYNQRSRTYMNEELTIAIEELRLRPTDKTWFIPVLLNDCQVPNRSIGGGETLHSFHFVSLFKNWHDGVTQILSVIQPDSAKVYELISGLNAQSARTRIKSADQLGELGLLAEQAIPKLVNLLDDENSTVVAAAIEALSKIDLGSDLVVSKLTHVMNNPKDLYVDAHAAKALERISIAKRAVRIDNAKKTVKKWLRRR